MSASSWRRNYTAVLAGLTVGALLALFRLAQAEPYRPEPYDSRNWPTEQIAWGVDCPNGIPLYSSEIGLYWDQRRCYPLGVDQTDKIQPKGGYPIKDA